MYVHGIGVRIKLKIYTLPRTKLVAASSLIISKLSLRGMQSINKLFIEDLA